MKISLAIGVTLLCALPVHAQRPHDQRVYPGPRGHYPVAGSQLNPAAFGAPPSAAPPAGVSAPVPSASPSASAAKNAATTAGFHAAVARIVAPGDGSISYGSGTLVHVTGDVGIVITNWHVINEATGPISVHFSDGFYSLGTVQNVDQDWDLAAIAIRRPNITPVPIAEEPPRPGEMLTIAGYGSGAYRSASGVCTQYVAPGLKFPYEMVEVAVSARQGDSGGPIINARGELAGVLFGEGHGRTSGSYCGRVRWFLTSVTPRIPATSAIAATAPLESLPVRPASVASPGRRPEEAPVAALQAPAHSASKPALSQHNNSPSPSQVASQRAEAGTAMRPASSGFGVASGSDGAGTSRAGESTTETSVLPVVASTRAASATDIVQIGWNDIAGDTLGEQFKSVLAGIGIIALGLQALRWLGRQDAKA